MRGAARVAESARLPLHGTRTSPAGIGPGPGLYLAPMAHAPDIVRSRAACKRLLAQPTAAARKTSCLRHKNSKGQARRGAPRWPAWAATGPRRPSAAPCAATRLPPRPAGMLRRALSQRCRTRRRRARPDLSASSPGEPCSWRHCQGIPDPASRARRRALRSQRPARAGALAARTGHCRTVTRTPDSAWLPAWTCAQQASPPPAAARAPRRGPRPARRAAHRSA
jgi:hypothetical protein